MYIYLYIYIYMLYYVYTLCLGHGRVRTGRKAIKLKTKRNVARKCETKTIGRN